MIEKAASWLKKLAARGVTVTVRNNRIGIHPYGAFSQLPDEELLFLRHNREAIKAVVRGGFDASVASEDDEDHPRAIISTAPDQTPAEKTARSPTVPRVIDPSILAVVNGNTPEAIAERDTEATKVMMQQVGRPHPWLW